MSSESTLAARIALTLVDAQREGSQPLSDYIVGCMAAASILMEDLPYDTHLRLEERCKELLDCRLADRTHP